MSHKIKDKSITAIKIALSIIAPVIVLPIVVGGAYTGIQALRGVPVEQSMEQFRLFMTVVEDNAILITYVMMGLVLLQRYRTAVTEAWQMDRNKSIFALQGLGLGFAVFCVYTFVVWRLSQTGLLGRDTLFVNFDRSLVFTMIYMFVFIIMAPIAEELFFRYLVQNWLKKHNLILGLLAPSILNAFLHFENNPVQLIPFSLMFLCYGFAYHRSGKITIVIAAHMVTNALIFGAGFV